MKLRVTFLALLIAGMVGLAFFLVKPGEEALVEAAPPSTSSVLADPEPLPLPPAETEEQRAARLRHLDPALREAIIHLENATRQWEDENPDADTFAWEEFATLEIAKLEIPQILGIADAIRVGDAGWLARKFDSPTLQAWGLRDPAAARELVVETAEVNGLLVDGAGRSGAHSFWDEIFHQMQLVRLGDARRDPLAAWKQLLEDLEDPRVKDLSSKYLAGDPLEFYARQHPAEAWKIILSHPDLAFHLVPGFAMGAPAGQEWSVRLADYASLCRDAHGHEPVADKAVNSLLARWLTEDPDAALGWVDSHLGLQDFLSSHGFGGRTPPPKLPGLEAPPEDMLVRLEMMRDMYVGFWCRGELMNETLTALIAKGHRELAALVIADRLEGLKSDCRLHSLIRGFPDPVLREALLLTAVRKLPKPERDRTTPEEAEEHLAVIYSLWTLSADIEVSDAARRRAKTRLRVAYAAEQGAAGQKAIAR